MFHAHEKGASERSELTPCNIIIIMSTTTIDINSTIET